MYDGGRFTGTPSDASDEQLERVLRRTIRAELRVLDERLIWTFVSALGPWWGLFLVVSGSNGRGGGAVVFVVLGVATVVAAIQTLLLKWELPPYRPTPN